MKSARALEPTAVFELPVELIFICISAPLPMAVLPLPSMLLSSAAAPMAVLPAPVVLSKSAAAPTAVF